MNKCTKMTFVELCETDDLATSLVLDPLLGFSTHKMNITPLPEIQCWSILKQILHKFQDTHDFSGTFEALTTGTLGGDYFNAVGSKRQEQLRQHVYRYLRAFLVDSGVRIEACDRYSSETNGAKVTSTKHWLPGQRIEVLLSCLTRICAIDKDKLKDGVNDFSVMYSLRKKSDQLLLGPIGFINHDCNPNCKYVVYGSKCYVEVIQPISPGEELSCFYGDNFFEDGNKNCECCTCEKKEQGHFTQSLKQLHSEETKDPTDPRSQLRESHDDLRDGTSVMTTTGLKLTEDNQPCHQSTNTDPKNRTENGSEKDQESPKKASASSSEKNHQEGTEEESGDMHKEDLSLLRQAEFQEEDVVQRLSDETKASCTHSCDQLVVRQQRLEEKVEKLSKVVQQLSKVVTQTHPSTSRSVPKSPPPPQKWEHAAIGERGHQLYGSCQRSEVDQSAASSCSHIQTGSRRDGEVPIVVPKVWNSFFFRSLERIIKDFYKFRLGSRRGRKDVENVQQACNHSRRFSQYMACGLPSSAIQSDLKFFNQLDKLRGWPTYLAAKGYAPTTIKNMLNNVMQFLKHVETAFSHASELGNKDLKTIAYELKRVMADVQKKVVVHRQNVLKNKSRGPLSDEEADSSSSETSPPPKRSRRLLTWTASEECDQPVVSTATTPSKCGNI